MIKLAIVGAGKIGTAVRTLINDIAPNDYDVIIGDNTDRFGPRLDPRKFYVDATNEHDLTEFVKGADVVLNAGPYFVNKHVMNVCHYEQINYVDLSEDVATANALKGEMGNVKSNTNVAMVPQCGLAPGFVSIAAESMAKNFDIVRDIKLRVGALPQHPTNALKYNLTWSVDGLINEYIKHGVALVDGLFTNTTPLGDLEHIIIDGVTYEAFNTSGGLGSLVDAPFASTARNLNYKTLRYPGHRDLIKFLFYDMRLLDRPKELREILLNAVPFTQDDVVVISVSVSGMRDGNFEVDTRTWNVKSGDYTGMTAIEMTTAAGALGVIDLLFHDGRWARPGFINVHEIDLDAFLANRFGSLYQTE